MILATHGITRHPASAPLQDNAMNARIVSIVFDKHEQPLRATIKTRLGSVKVEWRDVCGDRCWMTSGILDAKKLAVPAIERIERMVSRL